MMNNSNNKFIPKGKKTGDTPKKKQSLTPTSSMMYSPSPSGRGRRGSTSSSYSGSQGADLSPFGPQEAYSTGMPMNGIGRIYCLRNCGQYFWNRQDELHHYNTANQCQSFGHFMNWDPFPCYSYSSEPTFIHDQGFMPHHVVPGPYPYQEEQVQEEREDLKPGTTMGDINDFVRKYGILPQPPQQLLRTSLQYRPRKGKYRIQF